MAIMKCASELVDDFNKFVSGIAETEPYYIWQLQAFIERLRVSEAFNVEDAVVFLTCGEEETHIAFLGSLDSLHYNDERRQFALTKAGRYMSMLTWGCIITDSLPKDVLSDGAKGLYFPLSLVDIPQIKEPTLGDIVALPLLEAIELYALFEILSAKMNSYNELVWVDNDDAGILRYHTVVPASENKRNKSIGVVLFHGEKIAITLEKGDDKSFIPLNKKKCRDMVKYIEERWSEDTTFDPSPLTTSVMEHYEPK